MTDKGLTPKQRQFVAEYLKDKNATQAAIRAGYSEKTAYSIGQENLKKPEIAAAVQVALDRQEKRTEITADYILYGIRDVIERCTQAEPVLDNEGKPTGEYRFEANAALKGYELLGKNKKLWVDKTEIKMESLEQLTDEQLAVFARRLGLTFVEAGGTA